MRIDTLHIQNFKKYADQTFEFDPQFNLLIGDNGSGKTTILDALAVAAGVWLLDIPVSFRVNNQRPISPADIRKSYELFGERHQFGEHTPVIISATGVIEERSCKWTRFLDSGKARTNNSGAEDARALIEQCYRCAQNQQDVLLPVIAYYGAGRLGLPSNQRSRTNDYLASRWAAFYDCLKGRIRISDIEEWFLREAVERGNRNGQWRSGFNAVHWALRQCVPGLSDLWFYSDSKQMQMMFEIDGQSQPLDSLSAGQRMMVALVADIAIKMVTQNAHLNPYENTMRTNEIPPVLEQTPGLVLIDELDVHLHPSWQRRIASDLKRTFPRIQFVCTTHSPQVIGELQPKEIILLSDEGEASQPPRSFGMDTNRVLEEIMDASPRNKEIAEKLNDLLSLIDSEDLDGAKRAKAELERKLGANDPELTYAESLISFLEMPLTET